MSVHGVLSFLSKMSFTEFWSHPDCTWHLTGHPVCTLRRRRSVSMPPARRTREINSPRRFRPLVRNATPAGVARPPFVQLFASSTGRPIYCQSRYTASRRYLLAREMRDRSPKDRRFCNCNLSMRAIRVILDPGECINQRRGFVLSGDHHFTTLFCLDSLFHSRSLCAYKIDKLLVARKFWDEYAREILLPCRRGNSLLYLNIALWGADELF